MPSEDRIRPARPDDIDFLWSMLYEAANWRDGAPRPPHEEMHRDDHTARYLDGWGRAGDLGVIAERGDEPVGAAWFRALPRDRPGWGFVDEHTPELAIGVRADCRGEGVGSALLRTLIEGARSAGFEALSLSVEMENPALRLYERFGFVGLWPTGESLTMRLALGTS